MSQHSKHHTSSPSRFKKGRIATFKLLILLGGLLAQGEVLSHIQANSQIRQTCSTVEECDQLLGEINQQVGSLNQQQTQAEAEKRDLQAQREKVQQEMIAIQGEIEVVKEEILDTQRQIETAEIQRLRLEEEIAALREKVNRIIVLNDRLQRKNPIFTWLSESESISELIQTARNHQKVSNQIKGLVDELALKVRQMNRLLEKLEADRTTLELKQTELETKEAQLEERRDELIRLEQQIQKEIQRLQSLKLEANEIKSIIEEQKNEIIAASNETFMIPMEAGYVTCEFGCYVDKNGVPHNGIDLGNYGNTSTKIFAAASGRVVRSGWHSAYGNHVIITHNLNGQIFTTVYAHMHQYPFVQVGQTVNKGQQLGTMGTSGNSTGPHLHFELYEGYYNWPHSVNPRKYINFPSRW